MPETIRVERLVKSYGTQEVLHGISFSVKKGEVFALLGVNGAGKTTALECVEGLRRYESGNIEVTGTIGIQLQSSSLPPMIKAGEALRMFAKWKRTEVDLQYLDRIGVTPFLKKQYNSLSTGQKRRLHLALSMLGDPEILFLDEPTAGLDVEGRAALHEEIRRLKANGKTIVMASHDMAEVEELCDRIAILKDGMIAFIGTAAELTSDYSETFFLQVRFSGPPALEGLKSSRFSGVERGVWTFETADLAAALEEISRLVREQKLSIRDIRVERETLEQRFLAVAKEEIST